LNGFGRIVGLHLQADDAADIISAGCQPQHTNEGPRVQLFEKLHAAHARHHRLQDDKGVLT